jgi:hypothetical protein
MNIKNHSTNWRKNILSDIKELGEEFWNRFTPVPKEELENLEKKINRKLPEDFKEFYSQIGYGTFERGGNVFYSPEDILHCLGAPIYFVRGSQLPGSEWATAVEHRDLWESRAANNPNPKLFTEDILSLDGIKLYDLLQFGSDGNCCYHQLYLSPESTTVRYCLLTDSGTIEKRASSFTIALKQMIEEFIHPIFDE